MATFNLPELGEGLEEGEIVSWKVKEGGSVEADQTMVEVMTDKATVEVPAPASGKVTKLHYKEGDSAVVGQALIEIEESGSASSSKPKKAEESKVDAQATENVQSQKREASTGQTVASAAPVTSTDSKILASPAVRKMARNMGVDLTLVDGSGDRGRVLRTDLETVSSGSAPSQAARKASSQMEERQPYIGIRRKIGDALSKSMFTAVHFTHHDEADWSKIMELRQQYNEWSKKKGDGTKLTFLPFYIKAAIPALKKFPIMNSMLDEKTNEVVIKHYYDFGISVQTDNGLMVAVVRDCENKDVWQLANEIKEVVERARTGKASRDELTGSSITITNVGSIGGLHSTPVINFPETAILGMFEIKKRPVVVEIDGEDQLEIKPMMYMNVTCDHRIIDGAIAAQFLKELIANIEDPARMAFF